MISLFLQHFGTVTIVRFSTHTTHLHKLLFLHVSASSANKEGSQANLAPVLKIDTWESSDERH